MSDWQTVPKVPNEAMKYAAFGPALHGGRSGPVTVDYIRQEVALNNWRKMLAAAPSPPAIRVTPEIVEAARIAWNLAGLNSDYIAGKNISLSRYAALERALNAALAVSFPIQQDWQPIATAPKDQVDKLLLGPTGVSAHPTYIIIGHWYKTSWLWGLPAPDIYEEPTHWQPLPAPPGSQDADDIGQQEPGADR